MLRYHTHYGCIKLVFVVIILFTCTHSQTQEIDICAGKPWFHENICRDRAQELVSQGTYINTITYSRSSCILK